MFFKRYKKTDFGAGGLFIDEPVQGDLIMAKGVHFKAPKRIDHRDFCIPTNDQGQTSECTGYSTAGYIEIKHWQKEHFPKQYNASKIYKAAKKIDGHSGEGSWLRYAVRGAMNEGMIKGKMKVVKRTRNDLKFAILEYGACIGAFKITNEWNKVQMKSGRIADLGNKARPIGGHAVLICGYDEEGIFIQNSWSSTWGVWGFCLLPWKLFDKQFYNGVVIEDIEIL